MSELNGATVLRRGDKVLLCVNDRWDGVDVEDVVRDLHAEFPGVRFTVANPVSGVLVQREDVDHARATGQPDPRNSRCGCHCALDGDQ